MKETLDLMPFSKTKGMNLSGGNKRKLCCAMSLIGCPTLEFLDEPTTGVDPVSRRSLFKMLKNLRDSSLILTTHRMDEAESLCDNIAIMINGQFVCYGSPGHLKSTYGEGYIINVKHHASLAALDNFVQNNMPFLEKKETFPVQDHFIQNEHGMFQIFESHYQVKKDIAIDQIGLHQIFRKLCLMRFTENLIIEFQV